MRLGKLRSEVLEAQRGHRHGIKQCDDEVIVFELIDGVLLRAFAVVVCVSSDPVFSERFCSKPSPKQ